MIAAAQGRSSLYTPQLLRNGNDWRDWGGSAAATAAATVSARASITLHHVSADADGDQFTAKVGPLAGRDLRWSAYWSVTEHGHTSKVAASENAGNTLAHDFVVRQYVPMGAYQGKVALSIRPIAVGPLHPRQINLVVLDPVDDEVMQAISLVCAVAG